MAKHKSVFGKVIVTPKGRVSFPYLSQKNSGGDYPSDKYELTLLVPKDADLKALKAECLAVAKAAWPKKVKEWKDVTLSPFRDGDDKPDLDGYPGCWVIKPKTKQRPGIVRADKTPMEPEEVYAGCWARVSVKPFTYEQGGQIGVTLALNNVQFITDGQPFGGKNSDPNDDFDAVAVEAASADAESGADDDDF